MQSIYARFEKYADKTFDEAAERYVSEFQGKCLTRVQTSIDAVRPYVGTMRLIDIDDEALAQFKHDRLNGEGHFDRPAMVGTVNKDLTQIITILNRACRIWRWLPSTPQFVRVEGDTRTPYPLTWEEQGPPIPVPSYRMGRWRGSVRRQHRRSPIRTVWAPMG